MRSIDLNCDMGEGAGSDHLLMPYISSANIACGYHAGDAATIDETIRLCLRYGVAIGAHPSFDDKKNFGRTEMQVDEAALYRLVLEQVHLIKAAAEKAGGRLHHVKPHGALYNMAAKDAVMASVIAKAVKDADPALVLYGLSNSCLLSEAEKIGLKTASEVFADRTYRNDGSLTPRTQRGAIIENEQDAIAQAMQMVQKGSVITVTGNRIDIKAETICLHGDGSNAVAFAKRIKETFNKAGIEIKNGR